MKDFTVFLSSIQAVKGFVNIACKQPIDIDIVSGRHLIDAKSIMAIFSLELSRPVRVEAHGNKEECDAFYEAVREYVVASEEDLV